MKTRFTIFALLFFQLSFSQNLVSNWSFEDTIGCPTGYAQIDKAVGWSSYRETPDYFNSCNPSIVSVPNNIIGFQEAHSGVAYAGIVTYNAVNTSFREFIGAQLSQPLQIGQKYFVSFYASAGYSVTSYVNLACNKLGARFSTIPFSYTTPAPVNNYAHIFTNNIISDTLNWTFISGSFISDSVYNYLTIGNFFDGANTSILALDTNVFENAWTYIDDIKVSLDSTYVNTAIQSYSNSSIKVFPNPARDWIVLEGKGIKSVVILNALGSEIGYYPTTAFTLHNQINFGSLSCGVYFFKINMIDDKFHFQKIIVQY